MKLSKIPKKTMTFKLNDLYEGIEFEGNLGFPLSLAEEMASGDTETVVKGLCQIILSWNITDEDDNLLPIDEQTMRQIPGHLISTMTNAIIEAMGKVEKK